MVLNLVARKIPLTDSGQTRRQEKICGIVFGVEYGVKASENPISDFGMRGHGIDLGGPQRRPPFVRLPDWGGLASGFAELFGISTRTGQLDFVARPCLTWSSNRVADALSNARKGCLENMIVCPV